MANKLLFQNNIKTLVTWLTFIAAQVLNNSVCFLRTFLHYVRVNTLVLFEHNKPINLLYYCFRLHFVMMYIYSRQCHSVRCLLAHQCYQVSRDCLGILFCPELRFVLPHPVRETIVLRLWSRAVRQHLILPCTIKTQSIRRLCGDGHDQRQILRTNIKRNLW